MFSISLLVAGTYGHVTKQSLVQPPTFAHRGDRHSDAWSTPPQVKRPSRSVTPHTPSLIPRLARRSWHPFFVQVVPSAFSWPKDRPLIVFHTPCWSRLTSDPSTAWTDAACVLSTQASSAVDLTAASTALRVKLPMLVALSATGPSSVLSSTLFNCSCAARPICLNYDTLSDR